MRRIFVLSLLALVVSATGAMAATITFDCDNVLNGFTATVDGSTTPVPASSFTGYDEWSTASTYTFAYDPSREHTFVWTLSNNDSAWAPHSPVSTPSRNYTMTWDPRDNEFTYNNPMAYIGIADLGSYGTLYSGDAASLAALGATWEITRHNGSGGSYTYVMAFDEKNSTWYYNYVKYGSTIDYDFDGANWLGVVAATSMEVTLHIPAQTPIPGAVWLLGTGLIGLIGLRGRFRS